MCRKAPPPLPREVLPGRAAVGRQGVRRAGRPDVQLPARARHGHPVSCRADRVSLCTGTGHWATSYWLLALTRLAEVGRQELLIAVPAGGPVQRGRGVLSGQEAAQDGEVAGDHVGGSHHSRNDVLQYNYEQILLN